MRLHIGWISAGLVTTAALTSALTMMGTSCSQTPTNVPLRTFERAGRMDVLCMQAIGGAQNQPIPAIPVTLDHCAPVATGVDPTTLSFHTIAVVTQTLRGELAVVDLTLGKVIDTSKALPGTNFLPVGQNPTDVVVTPDAQMVFVAAAETNKPAIYMIPSTQLLGDSANLDEPTQANEQVALPSWPACALPQKPGRMVIVPTGAQVADGGADGGDDAGATEGYEIVVEMPGNGTTEDALVGLIDTAAFSNGSVPAGSLVPCPIKSIIKVAENPAAVPASWTPGPTWQTRLPCASGDVDLFAADGGGGSVLPSKDYSLPLWACPASAHPAGGDAGVAQAPLNLTTGARAKGAGLATDGRYVWIADAAMPLIHVIDTGTPGVLTELAPLLVTSIAQPSRVITTSELAISPVTRDYKRYLYAIDATAGNSVIVYDVTDPVNGSRNPLTRPNPELDPLQAADRITFSSPVATLTFARHDFAVPNVAGPEQTGQLCNPNPNAGDVSDPNALASNPGINYRANGTLSILLGPDRLRGVFAFATLTNGQVAAIDVDDWDAPCRRPIILSGALPGATSIAEPNPSNGSDTDPYHAPVAGVDVDSGALFAADGGLVQWVTDETAWPVIQPHHARSFYKIEDDLTGNGGLHNPVVTTTPQLLINGAPVTITAQPYAIINAALPEVTTSIAVTPNTAAPNIYMAHEEPDVHVDQTWNIVYEGPLPFFNGVAVDITTTDNYQTMTFSGTNAFFCGHGVEDQRLGLQRFAAMQVDDAVMPKMDGGVTSYIPMLFDQRVGDYVQITDDILGAMDAGVGQPLDDAYWTSHNPQDCWNGITTADGHDLNIDGDNATGLLRQQVCIDKFGAYGADQNPQRDFPILEAYEDHVVLGRYAYLDQVTRLPNARVIAPRDTSTQTDFKMAQCCFANQAHFNVRAGAEWLALPTATPFLHHVIADPNNNNACVLSCDPKTVLLSSRAPELAVDSQTTVIPVPPTRNSPFAMRNPAFSFYMPASAVTGSAAQLAFSVSIRDNTWQFATRGQYSPLQIALTAGTTSVLPQSSMFVAPLGAIAVVDGSAQGLFIIDLNTLLIAGGSPFN